MKTRTKALLLTLCAVVMIAGTAYGTYAYLTDSEAATNTFTVGKVGITLDETDVDNSSVGERDTENKYHLIPGHTYVKDPTVTVDAESSESYVRMMVTVNYSSQLDAIFAPGGAKLIEIFNGYDAAKWVLASNVEDTAANTRTYEFRYATTVAETTDAVKLDALFDSFTVPGEITKEQLATLVTRDDSGKITSQFTISVEAHAIQAAGFETADQAWEAFESQLGTNS